ncbi:hypothetical protein MK079_04000 [Candidatus Gracilibacteria bacterium]|nr:hypothetical protein [Candidatus Gracilibacteria bacterium]
MWTLQKAIFTHTIGIYRFVSHWIVSKIILLSAMIGVFVLFLLPFVALLGVISVISSVSFQAILGYFFGGNVGEAAFAIHHGSWLYLLQFFELIFILAFVFLFLYSHVLLQKIHLNYAKKKKLAYLKNDFFDTKKMGLFARYLGISLPLILLPILVFGFILWLILLVTDGGILLTLSNSIPMQIFFLVLFAGIILFSVYILFRLYFGVILLSEKNKLTQKDTARSFLKKSFSLTLGWKKCLTTCIPVLIFIGVIIFPVSYLDQRLGDTMNHLQNYTGFQTLSQERQEILKESDFGYYYRSLEIAYSNRSDAEIRSETLLVYIGIILFQVLHFLFLFGLFEMLLVNIYLQVMKK